GRSGRPWREAPNFLAAGILLELKASLKPGGVLFSSNSRGHNEEGWSQGRYGAYHDLDAWCRYMSVAGFVELSHYYCPAGLPRERPVDQEEVTGVVEIFPFKVFCPEP